jgi:hypothetical protein
MGAAGVGHVLLELIDVSVRTENGSISGIEPLKEPVTEGNGRLRVVASDKQGRAPDVAESSLYVEVGIKRERIFYRGAALVIEEFYGEIGIDRALIGIRGWSGDLVAACPEE